MNTIDQNLAQKGELTHDVPVTKSIFSHAGIFLTIVFVLFLGAEAKNIIRFTNGSSFSARSMSHNQDLANNHHTPFKKF